MDVHLPITEEYLELNKNTKKDEVIRKKIARYYFVGEFDISPFTPLSVIPEVLSLIEGGAINKKNSNLSNTQSHP